MMDINRYKDLELDKYACLTNEERLAGWHFCPDFDGMLIGPGMPEFELSCLCGFNWDDYEYDPI